MNERLLKAVIVGQFLAFLVAESWIYLGVNGPHPADLFVAIFFVGRTAVGEVVPFVDSEGGPLFVMLGVAIYVGTVATVVGASQLHHRYRTPSP